MRGGESLRGIAAKFELSRSAVQRHFKFCLRGFRSLNMHERKLALIRRESVTADTDKAYEKALEMLTKAEAEGDKGMIAACSRHVERILALKTRLTSPHIAAPTKVTFAKEADWRAEGRAPKIAVYGTRGVDPYSIDRTSRDVQLIADSTPEEIAGCDLLLRVRWVQRRPNKRFESAEEKAERLAQEAIAQYNELSEPDKVREILDGASEEETSGH